jgi:hypothetical protein
MQTQWTNSTTTNAEKTSPAKSPGFAWPHDTSLNNVEATYSIEWVTCYRLIPLTKTIVAALFYGGCVTD